MAHKKAGGSSRNGRDSAGQRRGVKRFGELKKLLGGISQKVLTANLRQMEEAGLLTRTVYAEVPPRVEYALTETGRSLRPVLEAMLEWGTRYKAGIAAAAGPTPSPIPDGGAQGRRTEGAA